MKRPVGSSTGLVEGTKMFSDMKRDQLLKNNSDSAIVGSTSECPTHPPYVAVATATQQREMNNSSNNTGIGSQLSKENSSIIETAAHPSPAPQLLWSFTNMLVIIVATGSSLLILNLLVIACFCTMRRRASNSSMASASILFATKDSALQPTTSTSLASSGTFVPRAINCAGGAAEIAPENRPNDQRLGHSQVATNRTESFNSVIDLTTALQPQTNYLKKSADAKCIANNAKATTVERGSSPLLLFDAQAISQTNVNNCVRPAVSLCDLYGQGDLTGSHQHRSYYQQENQLQHSSVVVNQRNASFHEITV